MVRQPKSEHTPQPDPSHVSAHPDAQHADNPPSPGTSTVSTPGATQHPGAANVSVPGTDASSSTGDASTPSQLRYTPCTIRLDQIDAQTLRHVYCHRDGDSLKWDDESRPDNLRSLGESLLGEGQLVPVEFYRHTGTTPDGNQVTRNILVRGYRLVEAVQQIISRRLDPERFHAGMEIKAVEITGGGEADYLVRAIASNEVRCALSPEAQYRAAAMLLDRGVSESRGARALGVSPTQFGRYIQRYNNPWMQDHVRAGHVEQSYADDLLDMANRTNRVSQLQAQMTHVVDQAKARINVLRDRAKATKQKWDDERQGVVSAYIPKKLVTKWKKALEKGEDYTPQLSPEVIPGQDWTFTFEITEKDGKFKIEGLNGLALAQKSYSDLALILNQA